jgi:type IV pilus assembly protein PilA
MRREHTDARVGPEHEAGFTLIELMMVVLIIAILMAVMLPMFLGARARANDRAMQTSLRNAVTAARAVYVDGQDYTQATPARLNAEGVPVKFVAATATPQSQNEISDNPATTTYIVMSGLSKSGTCFYVADDMAAYGTVYAKVTTTATCAAAAAPPPTDPIWGSSW